MDLPDGRGIDALYYVNEKPKLVDFVQTIRLNQALNLPDELGRAEKPVLLPHRNRSKSPLEMIGVG